MITAFLKSIDHKQCKLAIIFLGSLLTACSSIQYPVWLGDNGVEEMCESDGTYSFTHLGVTKEFEVKLVNEAEIFKACGPGRGIHDTLSIKACILGGKKIFVQPGNLCPKFMAHELSHGFGMHFVDRPQVHRG